MGSKLTCATIDSDNKRYATAASLDHVIAKQINPNGKAPLVLSVGAASTAIKEVLSFSAAGTAFPATVNPLTDLQPADRRVRRRRHRWAADRARPPTLIKRRQSVLDLVQGRPAALSVAQDEQGGQGLVQTWIDLLRTHGDRA